MGDPTRVLGTISMAGFLGIAGFGWYLLGVYFAPGRDAESWRLFAGPMMIASGYLYALFIRHLLPDYFPPLRRGGGG